MTRYSLQPRYRKHIKGYGYASIVKNLAKSVAAPALKAAAKNIAGSKVVRDAGKQVVQKSAEMAGNTLSRKIAELGAPEEIVEGTRNIVSSAPEIAKRNIPPALRKKIIRELKLANI